jgi:glc operon protein GlcG
MKLAVLALAGMLAAFSAVAQQKPNPLDNVPDQMPFDIPYGMPIALQKAQAAMNAAMAEAHKRGWKMNVAVVDPGGRLIAFARMDGAQVASVAIAEHKARAAAMYRRETKVFEGGMQAGFNYLLTLDDIIASRGGIPIVEDGKLVGAIGCSGGTGSQDEVTCKAGLEALKR